MKGAYCLVIELKKNSSIKIGALGTIKFKKGLYCYVGSALNNRDILPALKCGASCEVA